MTKLHKMTQALICSLSRQSRTAARKELLDQMNSPDECEKRYEEALWCLYALRDDIAPEGQTSLAGDQNMVDYGSFVSQRSNTFFTDSVAEVTRTKLRLHRCRLRMKMDDISRVRDARADHNLDDVQRFPPPWDLGVVIA
jgi:serine/threonine-protein kinase ULK2